MTEPTKGVVLPSDNRPPTLGQRIAKLEPQFQTAMPRGAEATQLVRDAMTCLSKTPKLQECEPATVLGGLMTLAQLGLRPGVLGHAWLLPFYNNKSRRFEAQLILGYQGMVELAYRSGKVRSVIARTVRENDRYEVRYGLHEDLIHVPSTGERGEPIAYYATVHFTNGGAAFWPMTIEEVRQHRDRYAMAKTKDGTVVGPWRDNFEQMAHKTCLRALAKFMPKGTDLSIAMAVDESVRVDVTPTTPPEYVSEHPAIDTAPETPSAVADLTGHEVVEPPADDEPPPPESTRRRRQATPPADPDADEAADAQWRQEAKEAES